MNLKNVLARKPEVSLSSEAMKRRNLKIRGSKDMRIPSGVGWRTRGTRRRRATLEHLCGVKDTPPGSSV